MTEVFNPAIHARFTETYDCIGRHVANSERVLRGFRRPERMSAEAGEQLALEHLIALATEVGPSKFMSLVGNWHNQELNPS